VTQAGRSPAGSVRFCQEPGGSHNPHSVQKGFEDKG
jgi:hypothetical protein